MPNVLTAARRGRPSGVVHGRASVARVAGIAASPRSESELARGARRRERAPVERERCTDERDEAGGARGVTDLRLRGREDQRGGARLAAIDRAVARDLGAVAEARRGAVRLHEITSAGRTFACASARLSASC